MGTTVTSKGQVTIPKTVRNLLGIQPGTVVEFEVAEDGRVFLVRSGRKAGTRNPFTRIRGRATAGLSTEQIMQLTRGEP